MTTPLRAVVYRHRLSPTAPPEVDAHDQSPTEEPSSSKGWSLLAPISLLVATLVWAAFGVLRQPELKFGVLIVLGVSLVGYVVLLRLGRGRAFDLAGIAIVGLGAKLAGVAVRYDVIFGEYEGVADAGIYHEHGERLAAAYRTFDFSAPALQEIPGTGFIRVVLGYVYAALGSHITIGFIAFGVFGFVGAWCFYRAMEIALPTGNHRRYALLVFLWPSMLFWPSSIGKDSWMIMGLGVAAYGAARVLARRRLGFVLGAAGLWAIAMVRPHVALVVFGAFAVAYVLRPTTGSSLGPVPKVIGLVVLFLASGVLFTDVKEFLEIEDFDRDSIEEKLDETEDLSRQGGSSFEPPDPWTPVGYVAAVVTLVARPFPWEADNAQMIATSLEGLVLAALLTLSVVRLARSAVRVRRWPFVTMAIAYTMVFAFAFASIANFGILARQRTQVLPFLFVLICLPAVSSAMRSAPTQRRRRRAAESPRALRDVPGGPQGAVVPVSPPSSHRDGDPKRKVRIDADRLRQLARQLRRSSRSNEDHRGSD